MPPLPSRADIDPALKDRLKNAAPGDRVEALVLLRPVAAGRLRARAEGEGGAALQADSVVPEVVARARGALPPEQVEVRVFASLGALFVQGPVEVVRRLVTDPDVLSATLPDKSE